MKFFKQIKKNPLFANLTDKEIEAMFDCLSARIEKKSPRDIVSRPNEEISEICIILEGNLVEFTVRPGGERVVVSSKVDGDMFGLPYCYSASNKSETFITAATECYLLFINAESILKLCEKACECHRKMNENLVKTLCETVTELKCNNDFITIKGMRKKIAKFIYDKYAEQALRIIQSDTHGKNARIIGRVTNDKKPEVILRLALGQTRIIDMLSGEQLPRIC